MESENKLKVGDRVYGQYWNNDYYLVGEVDRVTSTIAFIGENKFKISFSSWGSENKKLIDPIPKTSSYDRTFYYLENEAIKEASLRTKIISSIIKNATKEKLGSLSIDGLLDIHRAIKANSGDIK